MHAHVDRNGEQLIPVLLEEPGFAGAMSFFDRQSGDSMMVVFWTTVEQARRSVAWQSREPVTIWDVSVRV